MRSGKKLMNITDRRHMPIFERSVVAIAGPLLRSAIELKAWQVGCVKHPPGRAAVAIALHAIEFTAGALGAAVRVRRWFVSEVESSDCSPLHANSFRTTH